MSNDLDQFFKNVSAVAQNISDFLQRDEVKLLASKLVSGLHQFGEIIQKFYSYSQDQKKMYIEMSQYGWFPSYLTFKTPAYEGETVDSYMERCLIDNLDDVKQLIIESYPHRMHIFEEAFKLFDEERYIAAIPLFLSQLDGLSVEYGLSPFFTNTKNSVSKSEIKGLSDEEKLKLDKFPIYLKKALENKLLGENQELISYYQEVIVNASTSFIGENTKNLDMNNSINKLNRHGILHGHVDFLEYADKRNCLKVISLILFVDHILSLIENKYDQTELDSVPTEIEV
ncbi:hypothetical protein [Acinetobacter bereziniae]|uniref:hypothetical protein n=1 Tax=Acinetobacter bereziniae TaxID=106648 RepID=UPI00300A066F